MALPPLVDVATFAEWLGRSLDGDDATRAEATLFYVSSLVRSEAGRTWVDDANVLEDVPGDVEMVVLDVARQVFNNPDNNTSESIGDWSAGKHVDFVGLRLRPEQKAILGRYRTNARGLWTQAVTRDDPDVDTAYVPIEGTESVFPWYASSDEIVL